MEFTDNQILQIPSNLDMKPSRETDSSSEDTSRYSTSGTFSEQQSNASLKVDRDFFDQKNQSSLRLRQIKQTNQTKLKISRKKKRDDFVSKKRMIFKQSVPGQCSQKSNIFQITQILRQESTDSDQYGKAIKELSQIMNGASEQQIFELIETGISPSLMSFFKQTSNLDLKTDLSYVFTSLTQGQKREMNKLINSGLIRLLIDEITNSSHTTQISNCILALGNICITEKDFRDRIIQEDPNIFKKLFRFTENNSGNTQIVTDITYFVSCMITQKQIYVHTFIDSFVPAVELLSKILQGFRYFDETNFENEFLNQRQNQNLLNIVETFQTLLEIDLKVNMPTNLRHIQQYLNDPLGQKQAAQVVEDCVNEHKLFGQLLRILDFSNDEKLIKKTWTFIGQLCCNQYSYENVKNFMNVGSQDHNMMLTIQKCLTTDLTTTSPEIIKACIFTLSNLIADKSIYLQQILNMNMIQTLGNIWDLILQKTISIQNNQSPPLSRQQLKEIEPYVEIKTEIVYCVGNCVMGIADSLYMNSLNLLKQSLDQGALRILSSALEYQKHVVETSTLKIALESLKHYMKQFKKAQKSQNAEVVEAHGKVLDQMIIQIEFDGLDGLELCQFHQDPEIYRMSQKILLKFFEIDNDDLPILKMLDSISFSSPNMLKKMSQQNTEMQNSNFIESICPEAV